MLNTGTLKNHRDGVSQTDQERDLALVRIFLFSFHVQ